MQPWLEQLLQYQTATVHSNLLFKVALSMHLNCLVDHDYDASGRNLLCLETVEPGVTDRFVSSYEKTREQIRM